MTRRRTGRRAPPRRNEEERAPTAPPRYGDDVEFRLAEEVLYLHSLWRAGPPAPAPHPGGGSVATHVRADRRKRRRLERRAEPQDPGPDWPLAPSPPAYPSPRPWPDSAPSSPTHHPTPPPQQPSPASLAQRAALRAAEDFLSGHASDEGESESDGSESDDAAEEDDAAEGFFLGLFERDADLRGYYERSHEDGEFVCMGCVGRRARRGRARRFRDCASLVQHAHSATRCGRRRAHRALAAAVCRVLGWDVDRLPSIVLDPRGTLGQALAREAKSETAAAASVHETKDNADARENHKEDAAKLQEDAHSGLDDAPLSDGVAAKKGIDKGKSGPSSNGNNVEVHEQENVVESAEMEDTNPVGPLCSKDTPKEFCKAVQEEGAIDNKQEHAKSADDMGDICNVRLENNSSEEEVAAENKEELANSVVGTGDVGIGNHGLIDSTQS